MPPLPAPLSPTHGARTEEGGGGLPPFSPLFTQGAETAPPPFPPLTHPDCTKQGVPQGWGDYMHPVTMCSPSLCLHAGVPCKRGPGNAPPPLSPCFCAHAKGLCEWRLRSPKVTRKPGAPELGRWRPSLPLSAEDEARQRDPNRQVRVREQRGMQPGQAQKGERGKAVQPGWASNSEWGKHTTLTREGEGEREGNAYTGDVCAHDPTPPHVP
jgi:hypothetical protein